MIGACAIHAAARPSAEKVAAADNDTDLNAQLHDIAYSGTDRCDRIKIQSCFLLARQHLSAEFEQDAFVLRHFDLPFRLCLLYMISSPV